ncbi:MAG: 5'-nucleotidase, lipoprotein e(P4) family [Capnocytophaga sp.]|nr:5'-nucleotidase, lipoprotein e(P4) family [Capnocytophaga sp.]
MKKFNLFFYALTLIFISCGSQKNLGKYPENSIINNGKLFASFYHQQVAEYEALSLQAYNIARFRLALAIAENNSEKPLTIVTDIDETFLNNSYYIAYCANRKIDFTLSSWEEWTGKGEATPLSGALDFFKYAEKNGVQIFYITNRGEAERKGTELNLRRLGFPLQNENHLIFKTTEGSKENRRQAIAKNYNIVLLLGDNLADFSKDFDDKSSEERSKAVQKNASEFGKKFIILPNFTYGDWEKATYAKDRKLPYKKRDAIISPLIEENPKK